MNKIKFMLKRIFNMNYKDFFNTITKVNKKNHKPKLFIFFDIVFCGFKYQAGYSDYYLYDMFALNAKQRKTIITRGINNSFVKKFNDKNFNYIFNNKMEFNNRFAQYINRDWLIIDNNNFKMFDQLLKKHHELIAKPVDAQCGIGVELIVNSKDNLKLYNQLLANKQTLIEQKLIQCERISKLHPYSINTLRVVTLKGKVVTAYIRIGNNKNVVDNFHHYGLCAPINIKTGKVDYPAINKHDELFYEHPLTHEKIVGLEIPRWKEVVKYCESATKIVPEIQYIGWDVCVGPKDLFMVEGNEFPGHDLYQLPPHRSNGIGLLPTFEKVIKGDRK